MNARKALELLDSNKIEDLRKELQDELYQEALKAKPGAKKRYAAMKKYFGYHGSTREVLQKPCRIEVEGKEYISFCNSYSLALTTEDVGEIELFDTSKGNYPDVARLVHCDGEEKTVDFRLIFAEAKSKGYRLNKSEVSLNFKYLLKHEETYYKLGLFDATFSIIDDGEPVTMYYSKKPNRPITIVSTLGICMVMPVRLEYAPGEEYEVIEL